jgi:PAS domain S-box-containing protein
MNLPGHTSSFRIGAVFLAVLFAVGGGFLLIAGRADYPQLHTVLDTAMCVLAAVLAVSLWDLGARSEDSLVKRLALSFATAAALALLHILVTVEWGSVLAAVARSKSWLRPATWPPAAYVLPIGLLGALVLPRRNDPGVGGFALELSALSATLLALFHTLPPYAVPDALGVSRPALLLVPPLWLAVAFICWRRRVSHQIFPLLTFPATLLALAHATMLFSLAPHDTFAMLAHLGTVCGYLSLLWLLTQLVAQDMAARLRAEQALAASHVTLERSVRERTEELQSANALLQTEVATRREAEFALSDHNSRMRAIFETALDAVVLMDEAGRITEFNHAAERIFGYRRADAIGRRLDETLIPPGMREMHRQGLERYLAGGASTVLGRRLELTGLRADGSTLGIELSVNRMPGAGPALFAAFVRDITSRQQAEAALRESQSRFQTLAESLPHLVWTCLPDGRCDYLSRQWVEYTGRSEAEQLEYGWADQLHAEDRERVQAEWAEATARGDSFDVEFRIRRFDGVYRWFKTRAVPLRDAGGHIVKWLGSNTDFEDVKRSEERLRAQLAHLSLLDRITRAIGERQDLRSVLRVVLGHLEDNLSLQFGCVCLLEPGDESLSVACVGTRSQSLARQLALTEETRLEIDRNGLARCMRGQLVYEPDIAASALPLFARLARGGLGCVVIAPLLVESRVFGVMIAARRAIGSFTSGECEFLRQLNEHVALAAHQTQLYTALQAAYEDLRQTQQTVLQHERLRALGQMASGIAHDINNALSPAALYVESLIEREASLSTDARGNLEIVQRAIEDVAQTVARMREFSRPRDREHVLAPVDLNQTLRQVLELTRARWHDIPEERGIVVRIETDLAADLPTIMGAESEIRDAFTNVVLNAVDAMPEGGAITLRSRVTHGDVDPRTGASSPSRVEIDISDTGVGMSETTRLRCLEPFFTTKGERGTGLGLAMVYGMAQRHGAELEIQSEIGSGTTMRFTFVAATATPDRIEPRVPPRPAKPLRILIVDDDPLLLESLKDMFEQDGHTVATADGGQAGIDSFVAAHQRGERFSVVITDLGMPHIDGRTVAAAIKSRAEETPVILLTGWGHRLIADHDIPEHVDRVLAKPPKLAKLRAALAEMTEVHPQSSS